MRQHTIARPVSFEGISLHTGTHNTVTLKPAPADSGVLFRRVDIGEEAWVPCTVESVAPSERCTLLEHDNVKVSTVEHLLSALRGMGVDNVYVDVSGPEIPIGDGSAKTFVDLIEDAGVLEQAAERRVLVVEEPIWVRSGTRVVVALPYEGFRVSLTFTNDHNHPVLGDLFAEFDITPEVYRREIAPARTIGWLHEVEALQARGLALGASMEMAVVLSEDRILTPMRFPDEPVRHKILDVIGDLAVAGCIRAHIVALRSGHALNGQLARAIRDSITILEMK